MQNLAKKYQVKLASEDQLTAMAFQELLERVDAVPVSLVLAQAAVESAWGSSRFARDGHNYFGHWCYSKGCGMVPRRRDEGAKHEVRVFASPGESIKSYLMNLNTNRAYTDLRAIRAEQRQQGRPVVGEALAAGLTRYSQRGEAYVRSLQQIIHSNNFERFEDCNMPVAVNVH